MTNSATLRNPVCKSAGHAEAPAMCCAQAHRDYFHAIVVSHQHCVEEDTVVGRA